VGVLSGVYSTLFIATPIVVDLRKMFGMRTDVVEATAKEATA